MTEYKFFDGNKAPYYSELDFFKRAPHIPPEHQVGHRERTNMVASMVMDAVGRYGVRSVCDLGCGDGALLRQIRHSVKKCWGYDAGRKNIAVARKHNLDVRYRDICRKFQKGELADLVTCCEVLEHLYDPRDFLKGLDANLILISSPSAETPDWHYSEHAWGWDHEGYRELVVECGYDILDHRECIADRQVDFLGNGVKRRPQFQAILAKATSL